MVSLRCHDEEYWDSATRTCIRCNKKFEIKAGFEFNSNCGLNDKGVSFGPSHVPCHQNTFNNGSFLKCQTCSDCPAGQLLKNCTDKTDRICCLKGHDLMQKECIFRTTPVAESTTVFSTIHLKTPISPNEETTISPNEETTISPNEETTYPISLNRHNTPAGLPHATFPPNYWIGFSVVIFILLFLCLYLVVKKRKYFSRREVKTCFRRRSLKSNPLYNPDSTKELSDINDLLCSEIQAIPLQAVLNNMDVVEELVLLLDPETPGAKNTRHLAASCSLPFTWINYVYSMKASRSPLVAVLERVIAKNPHWNVGNFAGLLSNIGRNDAVAVLGKLTLVSEDV